VAVKSANGDMRLIQRLLELKANVDIVDRANRTPLFYAVRTRLDAVNLLLSANADPDAPSGFNVTTPLIEAASLGKAEIVETLLKAGADPTRVNENGINVWKAAVISGDVDTIKVVYEYLEENKNRHNASFADPRNGWMALHFACSADYVDVVQYLLDTVKVDINLIDSDGRTPLWLAAECNSVDTVELLLEYKADPTIPDKNGHTPEWIILNQSKLWRKSVTLNSSTRVSKQNDSMFVDPLDDQLSRDDEKDDEK